MRQSGEKETRVRASGWERPSVAMETGSYQLTPCFSTHSPPTTLPLHSQSVHLHHFTTTTTAASPSPYFLSLSPSQPHTPFHLSPHPPPSIPTSPSSISLSLSLFTSTTPLFLPTSPSPIPRRLHFHPLTVSYFSFLLHSFCSPSTLFFSLFSPLLRLNTQLFAKNPPKKRLNFA